MKRCLFSFLSLFVVLGAAFSQAAHAADVDETADFFAEVKLVEFNNPSAPLELWFNKVEGGDPVRVIVKADLFRSGYFGILPLTSDLASIAEKQGCSENVWNYQPLSSGNGGKLTLTRTHVSISEGPIPYIRIEARINYKYFRVLDGSEPSVEFKPSGEQFHSCVASILPGDRTSDLGPVATIDDSGRVTPHAELPSVAQAPGIDDPVDGNPTSGNLPNYVQGSSGCSLNAGASMADGAYALMALFATLPLLGRRKK